MEVPVIETEVREGHEIVARRALDWTLKYRDLPTGRGDVVVTRNGPGLQVRLQLPTGSSPAVRSMAAVRVTGALRAFDPTPRFIDVTCEAAP